jgi:hypothetical protein
MATFSDARRESSEAANRIQVGFYFYVHLGACIDFMRIRIQQLIGNPDPGVG